MFFFCEEVSVSVSGQSCWSFALFAFFFRPDRVGCFNFFFVFFFSCEKKTIRSPNVIRKAHAALSINTQTTKMPSEEQQLPEPLLDDGGNDRFVLFPLKYDAVWEMVRRRCLLRKKNILKNLLRFELLKICVC